MASNRTPFDQLLDKYEPILKAAFLDAIVDIRSQVTLKLLIERLERGDVAGAIEVLGIEREAFGAFELAFAEAYNAGGVDLANGLKLCDPQGQRIVFRFGVRNPEAEAWLAEHSATMVTRIVGDQQQSIRLALSEGLARGDNPRRTALDVVGRVSRVTGKREGGIIGLTGPQERFVASARQELVSGNLRAYLARERRDRRFDRTILAAIKSGKGLDRAMIDRIIGRYSDRLLDLRGEMLSRSETMAAIGKARDDAMRQAILSGKVDASFVTKTWRTAGDSRVRHTHRALNGRAAGYYEGFQSPSGVTLQYPGDPSAPIGETSGCRCHTEYRVDYTGQFIARRAA
ncbi:head morphogenesis protein [Devosia lacusdianchii]|uniref:head morphogenesis protein n=1 Tax=Devosia lacusdianchii TaxID=2917991 RepID=UPI001F054DAB|nr:head morphogenesis protein [Devosia sp. JXJ CY 41]